MGKIILGVDPGSKITGYAFLEIPEGRLVSPRDVKVIDAGALRVATGLDFSEKLGLLHLALSELVTQHSPKVGIFEKPFYGKNVVTTIRLAETRGALMAACARESVTLREVTPAEVKKTVAGSGQADKAAVAFALKALLKFDLKNMPFDVADAVAIALSYALRPPFEIYKKQSLSLPVRVLES